MITCKYNWKMDEQQSIGVLFYLAAVRAKLETSHFSHNGTDD